MAETVASLKLECVKLLGSPDEMTFGHLAKNCLNATPANGFTVEQMRRRLKFLDKIDEAMNSKAEKLDLTASEVAELVACEAEMRWALMSPELIRFSDHVRSLKPGKED